MQFEPENILGGRKILPLILYFIYFIREIFPLHDGCHGSNLRNTLVPCANRFGQASTVLIPYF